MIWSHVLFNPPFLAVDYCAKWLGLQIQFQTLCYKLSYIELAKGGFFSERADAFVISPNRQT